MYVNYSRLLPSSLRDETFLISHFIFLFFVYQGNKLSCRMCKDIRVKGKKKQKRAKKRKVQNENAWWMVLTLPSVNNKLSCVCWMTEGKYHSSEPWKKWHKLIDAQDLIQLTSSAWVDMPKHSIIGVRRKQKRHGQNTTNLDATDLLIEFQTKDGKQPVLFVAVNAILFHLHCGGHYRSKLLSNTPSPQQ